jgi:hypothetical protein
MNEYTIEIVLNPVVEIPLQITGPAMGPVPWQNIVGKPETFPPSAHIHVIADVIGLQSTLDAKAPIAHSHGIVDVTGLQAALDGKAQLVHSHIVADVVGLQEILDGKAPVSHAHIIGDVTGLQVALDGKASISHTHAISDIINLQDVLNQRGIPAGGTIGQSLVKVDGTDYNVAWVTISGGSGNSTTLYASARNAESFQINKGEAVYLYQATGDKASVKLASNTGEGTSAKTLGLAAENIAQGAEGLIICQGVLTGVNTSAFSEGQSLYLGSTAGSLTGTKPVAPNHMVSIGIVEKANAGAGQIYVRIQNGFELEELHNVLIVSPTNKQVLEYDSATSLWKNVTQVHSISDVTGLQSALDSKASSSHGHVIADITGLQTALDGKAATSHTHTISNITGLQVALDGKAAVSHTHVIADITGLQTTLDGKAASSHTHIIGDITGLQTALNTQGMPTGGAAGQVLTKVNATNYNAVWADPTGGTGGGTGIGFKISQSILTNFSTNQEATIVSLNLSGNRWGVSIVEEWDTVAGDSSYANVSLLLNFNGTNGSTTFTDSSASPKTVSRFGDTVISTAQSKYGGASAYFDGAGDYLQVANNSAFDFGSGDFTIEAWVYPTTTTGIGSILGYANGSAQNTNYAYQLLRNGAQWQFNIFNGSTSYGTAAGTVTANVWTHVALVRSGANLTAYINGQQITQANVSTLAANSPSGAVLQIGQIQGFYPWTGYIDDVRITKGVARYTDNFTPPDTQMPATPPQYETKYVAKIGGLNDTDVDYGIEKLSDASLKIRKMSATGNPVTGGGLLGSTVSRVYVNVLDYGATAASAVPAGGTTGQVLAKVDGTDYNTTWQSITGGTPGPQGPAGPTGPAGTPGLGFKVEQSILTNFSTNQESTITTGISLAGNKWGISIVEEWDATAGESDYANFSLLCHFDGSNGSSTFIDNSPRPKTLTPNGGVQIKTDQSKFGGASAYFGGTAEYVSSSSSSDFAFGTGDFTVECWVYSSDVSFAAQRGFLQTSDTAGGLKSSFTTGIAIVFGSPANGALSANVGGVSINSSANLVQTNTWYHIALVRSSGTSTLYINGSSVGSASTPGNCSGTYLAIGGYYSTSFLYKGYLDELRIIKGVAKYTGSFTPPSTAFLDYPPTTETRYIGSIGGLNDTNVDYGVEKLSDTSFKIRKMSATGNPVGGGLLGSTVNRVYVNLMDFGATAAASVPAGGTAGQVLAKVDGTDYNTTWQTVTSGTPGPQGPVGPAGPAGLGFKTEQSILTNFSTNQESTITTTGISLAGNKWGISIVEEWDAAGSGDSNYGSVAVLLNMNGSDNSTVFTDSSPTPKSVTAFGNAKITTSRSKYGGASGLFDGSGDHLTVAPTSDTDFGSGDFTVEAWVYPASFGAAQDVAGKHADAVSTNSNWAWSIYVGANNVANEAFIVSGGTVYSVTGWSLSLNQWQHIAFTRSSGSLRFFINGVQVGSTVSANVSINSDSLWKTWIGTFTSASRSWNGNIDDFRITKGVARYTANFTPPGEQFPASGPQVEMKYVAQIGGLNDTDVDYGIEKLSDSSLKIRKMSATGNPVTGGGLLGSTVNRVYVNLMDFGATAAASVPAGGTAGQVLTKVNGTDYNAVWANPSGGSVAWADITGKPSQFPPDTHTHGISDVTGLQTALDGKAASTHSHAVSDVTGLQALLDGKQKTISSGTSAPSGGVDGDFYFQYV